MRARKGSRSRVRVVSVCGTLLFCKFFWFAPALPPHQTNEEESEGFRVAFSRPHCFIRDGAADSPRRCHCHLCFSSSHSTGQWCVFFCRVHLPCFVACSWLCVWYTLATCFGSAQVFRCGSVFSRALLYRTARVKEWNDTDAERQTLRQNKKQKPTRTDAETGTETQRETRTQTQRPRQTQKTNAKTDAETATHTQRRTRSQGHPLPAHLLGPTPHARCELDRIARGTMRTPCRVSHCWEKLCRKCSSCDCHPPTGVPSAFGGQHCENPSSQCL